MSCGPGAPSLLALSPAAANSPPHRHRRAPSGRPPPTPSPRPRRTRPQWVLAGEARETHPALVRTALPHFRGKHLKAAAATLGGPRGDQTTCRPQGRVHAAGLPAATPHPLTPARRGACARERRIPGTQRGSGTERGGEASLRSKHEAPADARDRGSKVRHAVRARLHRQPAASLGSLEDPSSRWWVGSYLPQAAASAAACERLRQAGPPGAPATLSGPLAPCPTEDTCPLSQNAAQPSAS